MTLKIWSILFFTTSVVMSLTGMAAEVVVSAATLNSNTLNNNPHIRTLAASCAACHGTLGNAVKIDNIANLMPSLAGLDAAYFTTQMVAFKTGERPSTIMQRHAKGLNIDEINLLAIYFSQEKRITNAPLKSQTLKANHVQ